MIMQAAQLVKWINGHPPARAAWDAEKRCIEVVTLEVGADKVIRERTNYVHNYAEARELLGY